MARSRIERAKGELTVSEAATAVGASAAAVRNWMKQEPRLKKALRRQDEVWIFDATAVKILKEIREKRFKNAPASLQQAWAKRKAGAGKPRAAAAKKAAPGKRVAKASRKAAAKGGKAVNPGLEKAWAARRRNAAARRAAVAAGTAAAAPRTIAKAAGLSGDEAAKMLGMTKVRLYQALKSIGIAKPRTPRSFTPDIVESVRSFAEKSRGAASKATRRAEPVVREAASRAAATGDQLYTEALTAMRHAVDATNRMALEFRDTLRELAERQAGLLEKAMRTVRIRLATEE